MAYLNVTIYLYLQGIHVCIDFACICVQFTSNRFKTLIVSDYGTSYCSAAGRRAMLTGGGGAVRVIKNYSNPHMDLKL